MTTLLILQSIRPRQWTKNLVVFAALIFARRLMEPGLLLRTAEGFGFMATPFREYRVLSLDTIRTSSGA